MPRSSELKPRCIGAQPPDAGVAERRSRPRSTKFEVGAHGVFHQHREVAAAAVRRPPLHARRTDWPWCGRRATAGRCPHRAPPPHVRPWPPPWRRTCPFRASRAAATRALRCLHAPRIRRGFGAGLPYPARKMRMPSAARARAVASTCSLGPALHGPAMIVGRRAAISGNTMGNRSFISVWSAARCGFVWFFRAGAPWGPQVAHVVACAASPAVCARLPLLVPRRKGVVCGRCGGPVRMAAAGVEDLLEQHLVFVSVGRREPVPSDARLREARIAEEREGWPRFVAPTPHHS